MYAGDTKHIIVTVKDDAGNLVDLSEVQAVRFSMAQAPSGRARYNAQPIVKKHIGSGVDMTDGSSGKITITISPADTENICGEYLFEVEVVDAVGDVATIVSDSIIIKPTIIKADSNGY
jgi:hypothetical protein